MTTFYLVRHAHAVWTPEENRSLSAQGRQSADGVAEFLAGYPIAAIYSSPFQRAIQTINPLADCLKLPVLIEPDLRERELGNCLPEGFFEAVEKTWLCPSFAYPQGESNDAAQARGVAVLRRLHQQRAMEHIVLSTHGNLLALILKGYFPSINYTFWKALTMPDIYALHLGQDGRAKMNRLWKL